MSEISIRVATKDDAAALLEIYRPYVEQTAITFEYDVPTVDNFAARIEHTLIKYPYLIAEQEGEILGYAYAGPFKERAAYDWAVETSIYVKMTARGRQIGTRLYAELERLLKQQGILNVNACIAYPETEDAHLDKSSVKFHEALGYEMVGLFHNCGYKFGTWYHMVWMEKMIGEHQTDQPPVIWFSEEKR